MPQSPNASDNTSPSGYKWLLLAVLTLLCSCSRPVVEESPYSLTIYTSARRLNYRSAEKLLRSMLRTPKKDVGHAWVKLQGEGVSIEGGHSGEQGIAQAKYAEGVMDLFEYGYVRPTAEQKARPRYEPNPIRYLWQTQNDGHFAPGSDGHKPTYKKCIAISKEQFDAIRDFLQGENYPYQQYRLTDNQCSTLVVKVAHLAGIELDHEVTVPIEKEVRLGLERIRLREDADYAEITFSTPDKIEKSLKRLRS